MKYTLGNQDVDTSFITIEPTWKGVMSEKIKNLVGMSPPDSICEINKGSTLNYYINIKQFKPYVKTCASVLLNKKEVLNEIKKKTEEISSKIREISEEYINKVGGLTDEEIIDLLMRMNELQIKCVVYGTPVTFADIYGGITNKMLEIIREKKDLKNPSHIYTNVLGSPFVESITERAYKDIRNRTDDEKLLEDYYWLDQGYIGRGLTKDHLKEIRNHKNDKMPNKKELLEEIELSEEEERVFEVSRDLIFIKSLRADSRQFIHVVVNRIMDLLAKRYDVEVRYLETLCVEEVCDILRGKKEIPEDLEKRWAHSVFIPKDAGYEILIEGEANSYLEKHLVKEEIEVKDEVKGQVAQPGIVRGRVRLIFTPQHNDKVKEGDVLISTATSPQLLPAMKRAAAFVTDVGGITSHAAIVARELNKPCVVGTKIATKIFRDGDMVEVDADKGIVRRVGE